MFDEFLEKQRVEKALEKLVTKETAKAIAEGQYSPEMRMKAGKIDFVLTFLRGVSAEQISERMTIVSDVAIEHDGVVEGMISALMTITFGTLPNVQHAPSSRLAFVNDLQRALAFEVKIIHGTANGHVGIFGSSTRMAYTFLVPKFDMALARLGQMEFGKAEEIVLA